MDIGSLCVVMALGGVWGQVEPLSKSGETRYVGADSLWVKPIPTDSTDTTSTVSAGLSVGGEGTGQSSSMVVLLNSCIGAPRLVLVELAIQTWTAHFEDGIRSRSWLILDPLLLKMCKHLLVVRRCLVQL